MYLALFRRRSGLGLFVLIFVYPLAACTRVNTGSNLDDVFLLTEKVQLKTEGLGIYGCGAICASQSLRIFLLDPPARRIFVFEPSGEFLCTLGGPGQGPGEFAFPGAAKHNLLDDLFVIDIFRKRISIFDLEQGFKDSFILTGTQSQISDIRITSEKTVVASGFTRISPDSPEYGNWISLYDASGKYLTSFFPSSEYNKNWAWRISPGCLFDIDRDDNIYAVQHCDYRIEKYDRNGNLLAKFGSPSTTFVYPNTKRTFNTKGFASRSQLEAELRTFAHSWTRIVNILVVQNRYIIIVLEMNGLVPTVDTRYMIDIWDKEGRLVRNGIRTNMRLVCKDVHDTLYFVMGNGETDKPGCRISKYALRIDWNQ